MPRPADDALDTARFTNVGTLFAIQLKDGSLWIKVAADSGADKAQRPRSLKGWRTVRELREELRFPSDKACRAWLSRHGIVSVRRGRFILVDGLDVDRALRGMQRR